MLRLRFSKRSLDVGPDLRRHAGSQNSRRNEHKREVDHGCLGDSVTIQSGSKPPSCNICRREIPKRRDES